MIITQKIWFSIVLFIQIISFVFKGEKEKVEKVDVNTIHSSSGLIYIPSTLTRFIHTNTRRITNKGEKEIIYIDGCLETIDEEYICPHCHSRMEVHDNLSCTLKHLCLGNTQIVINLNYKCFQCEECGKSVVQNIPFKSKNHRITKHLENYIISLLETGNFTNKEVAFLTGVGRNIVKEIDKKRLIERYTINGDGKELIKPEINVRFLAIDEFKLHDGYKYATHIIDLETGYILWVQKGKKKQVVYDFINHVGEEFMLNVVAVACDMNSDFEEAFIEKYPHLKIVFDPFHIIKNFNEKVVSEIRKDEQKRLSQEGKIEEARRLKKSRYILTSSKETLTKKDKEVDRDRVIIKGSELFNTPTITRKGNYLETYETIIKENKLLFTADLVKEKLRAAYSLDNEKKMNKEIKEIIDICKSTENQHFEWFAKLLENHFDGIVSHALYHLSSGKIEGINNKIKTLRRQAYGYPDDEYFFLKLFDISRTKN